MDATDRAREIVYSKSMETSWKKICEERPWIGEELEAIVFRIATALTESEKLGYERGLREAVEVARNHEMTDECKQALRCNPNGKVPFVGSQEINGFDWACDEIATAIERLVTK